MKTILEIYKSVNFIGVLDKPIIYKLLKRLSKIFLRL